LIPPQVSNALPGAKLTLKCIGKRERIGKKRRELAERRTEEIYGEETIEFDVNVEDNASRTRNRVEKHVEGGGKRTAQVRRRTATCGGRGGGTSRKLKAELRSHLEVEPDDLSMTQRPLCKGGLACDRRKKKRSRAK